MYDNWFVIDGDPLPCTLYPVICSGMHSNVDIESYKNHSDSWIHVS